MRGLIKKLVFISVAIVMTASVILSGCSKGFFEVPDSKSVKKTPTTNLSVPEFSENKQFRIFADCPPTPKEEYLKAYKDAGFTHYNMTEDSCALTDADRSITSATSNDKVAVRTDDDGVINKDYLAALDRANAVGLKAVIRNYRADPEYFVNNNDSLRVSESPWNIPYRIPIRNITTELTSHPAVEGYYMGDEPSGKRIEELVPIVDWYNNYGGGTWFHLNLLQTYGSEYFKPYSYDEYVQLFCDKILSKVKGPKTLGTDYYPLKEDRVGKAYIMDGILFDYTVIAEHVNKFNASVTDANDKILTNFCIQSYNSKTTRKISSKADITFQTNLAIAFGAKNIQYYLYHGFGKDDGIVQNSSHIKNDMYYWVDEANEELDVIADAIMNFEWAGVKTFAGQQIYDENAKLAFEKIADRELETLSLISSVVARLDTVVTEMQDKDGNKGYMLVNYTEPSFARANEVMVYFSNKVNKAVVYADGERKVVDVKDNRLMLTLPAGGGAFVYPVYEGVAK